MLYETYVYYSLDTHEAGIDDTARDKKKEKK